MPKLIYKLLKNSRDFHFLYGKNFATHLPMALIALDKFNAPPEKLNDFYDKYSSKLKALSCNDSPEEIDFDSNLGDINAYESYIAFFTKKVEKNGLEETLQNYLPKLFSGCCASAFHSMIRLSYSIEINDEKESIYALAQFAAEHQYLGSIKGQSEHSSLFEIISDAAHVTKDYDFSPGLIVDKMLEVIKLDAYKQIKTQPKNIKIEEIAKLVVIAFIGTNNFTILHAVTSCHAMRILLPFLKEEGRELSLRYFWEAILVAYLSTGGLEIKTPDLNTSEDVFSNLSQIIAEQKTEHAIKMLYSCYHEYKTYGNKEYIHAANMLIENK